MTKKQFEKMSFRDKVYYAVSRIPKGETMTYKQVARIIGHPKAFRAVGNALNKNHNPEVPCHRVVRSDGKIGGYNKGAKAKKKLLNAETKDRPFRSVL